MAENGLIKEAIKELPPTAFKKSTQAKNSQHDDAKFLTEHVETWYPYMMSVKTGIGKGKDNKGKKITTTGGNLR